MSDRWWEDAACKGEPLDVFYPNGKQRGIYRDALCICAECPVKQECLMDALETELTHHRFGVRGGLVPNDRERMARTMRKAGALGRAATITPISHGQNGSYWRCQRRPEGACDLCRDARNRYQQTYRASRAAS